MQAISYQFLLLFRGYSRVQEDPDLEVCFYFSMLGLVTTIAFLHVFGSAPLLLLGSMS
jgi:hypothetical protein